MIGIRTKSYCIAIVSAFEIRRFNESWPCSELTGLQDLRFEFDRKSGDLIGHTLTDSEDGSAASAMAEDCKQFLFEDKSPDWRIIG